MLGLANRIKAVRRASKLPQAEFAQRLGVDRAHISRIENGKANPSEALLRLIAEVYEVRLAWLMEGEEPMPLSIKKHDQENMRRSFQRLGDNLSILLMLLDVYRGYITNSLTGCEDADPSLCPPEVVQHIKDFLAFRDSELFKSLDDKLMELKHLGVG